jgi:hypothetical protein
LNEDNKENFSFYLEFIEQKVDKLCSVLGFFILSTLQDFNIYYFLSIFINSTSNTNVAPAGIAPAEPASP